MYKAVIELAMLLGLEAVPLTKRQAAELAVED